MLRPRSIIWLISVFISALLFAGGGSAARAQTTSKAAARKETPVSKEIVKKEKELANLRKEIEANEKKLSESVKKEQTTLGHIENLERQANLIRRLIKKLREQEQQLGEDINDARSSIDDLEQQLESLKNQYAKYVRSVYKYGRVYDVELLFSSRSINQLYIRIEYLKRFSEQRAKDLQGVVRKKDDLESQNERLETNLQHERKLLAEKTNEEASLKDKVTQRQEVLASIRKDKRKYQQALKDAEQGVKDIEKYIAGLIEKDRLRKEREDAIARDNERAGVTPHPTPVPETKATGTFASRKGKLPWPVSLGTIASRFGNHVHPVLKTIRENTGIDIKVNPGSNVVAVADGEVSILTFIPGFGNTAILNHYDGYRTIYAHLAEITVVENQKVKAGDVIAKSGESVEGNILHFEIWKEKEKQNPEIWLAKQR